MQAGQARRIAVELLESEAVEMFDNLADSSVELVGRMAAREVGSADTMECTLGYWVSVREVVVKLGAGTLARQNLDRSLTVGDCAHCVVGSDPEEEGGQDQNNYDGRDVPRWVGKTYVAASAAVQADNWVGAYANGPDPDSTPDSELGMAVVKAVGPEPNCFLMVVVGDHLALDPYPVDTDSSSGDRTGLDLQLRKTRLAFDSVADFERVVQSLEVPNSNGGVEQARVVGVGTMVQIVGAGSRVELDPRRTVREVWALRILAELGRGQVTMG